MTKTKSPTCQVIRSTETYQGRQQINYSAGISAESAGADGLCMHLLHIPPGERAKAHLHENHETAIYTLSGQTGVWYGEGLQEHLITRIGDFLYIPAGVPHLPYNLSDTEPVMAIVARTDPNEQESVRLLPHLDQVHPV